MLHLTLHTLVVRFLHPIAEKLDSIEIHSAKTAHFFCRLIPSQCPPMCKLNPFYEQLVGLRFKALCYLADVCGEDIAAYC